MRRALASCLLAVTGTSVADTREVCGGEPVTLPGNSWSAIDLATGRAVDDLRQIAHADYQVLERADGTVGAALTPLQTSPAGAQRSTSMTFFFHRVGSYGVTSINSGGAPDYREFRVSLPSAEITRMTKSSVNLYLRDNRPLLNLGDDGSAGLEFDIAIDMRECDGTIADVQTLTFADTEGFSGNVVRRFDSGDQPVVDFEPGVHSTWHYSFRGPKQAGDTLLQVYRDSPKVYPDDGMLCLSNEAEFHYYVIYRAATEGAAWVPVRQLDWKFEMYASRPGLDVPWVGGRDVVYGGRSWVPDDFATIPARWPTWSRSWTAVEAEEVPASCAGNQTDPRNPGFTGASSN